MYEYIGLTTVMTMIMQGWFTIHVPAKIIADMLRTRNSAIADKPRDAFRDQSRSPSMVPFDVLAMVSY